MSEAVIRPALEAALLRAGGTHLFREDVVPLLIGGQAQWWARGDGAIVTELLQHPRKTVVNYWLVGGRMDDCLALQPQIDSWAREQGATHAIATGRNGWLRVLPRYGWRPWAIAYAKDLRA